jgi:hypothetical protein
MHETRPLPSDVAAYSSPVFSPAWLRRAPGTARMQQGVAQHLNPGSDGHPGGMRAVRESRRFRQQGRFRPRCARRARARRPPTVRPYRLRRRCSKLKPHGRGAWHRRRAARAGCRFRKSPWRVTRRADWSCATWLERIRGRAQAMAGRLFQDAALRLPAPISKLHRRRRLARIDGNEKTTERARIGPPVCSSNGLVRKSIRPLLVVSMRATLASRRMPEAGRTRRRLPAKK